MRVITYSTQPPLSLDPGYAPDYHTIVEILAFF